MENTPFCIHPGSLLFAKNNDHINFTVVYVTFIYILTQFMGKFCLKKKKKAGGGGGGGGGDRE